MRSLTVVSFLLASTAGAMSAEIKSASRIDAVTVYPAGAEVTKAEPYTVTYQIRPDAPRIVDGKALKYETPAKSRLTLDVPPGTLNSILKQSGLKRS